MAKLKWILERLVLIKKFTLIKGRKKRSFFKGGTGRDFLT